MIQWIQLIESNSLRSLSKTCAILKRLIYYVQVHRAAHDKDMFGDEVLWFCEENWQVWKFFNGFFYGTNDFSNPILAPKGSRQNMVKISDSLLVCVWWH